MANVAILRSHQLGNRFHTNLAGKVRRRLEEMCEWDGGKTASDLRIEALEEMGLRGPKVTIGGKVHERLRLIPILMTLAGLAVAVLTYRFGS